MRAALIVVQALTIVLGLGNSAVAQAEPAAAGTSAATEDTPRAPGTPQTEPPRAENPFREGTERVPLTPEERELLLEYTANSLNKLSRALDRAARQSEEEAYSTYVTAIIDVVIHSYRYKGRDELLMRVALNQGLALAYGVPSSDGKGVEVPAVLARARMQRGAVFNRVLKDTIELALKYLKQDQAGIEQGELSRLPYFELALERLRKLREWLPSVFEQEVQYVLILAGLEQFQSAVNHVTHQERLMHAQAMVGIDTILKEYPRDARPSEILSNPRLVRQLRVDFFEVARELVGKTERDRSGEPVRGPRLRSVSENVNFVVIQPGTFSMGSPEKEASRSSGEQLHQVTLTKGFEIQSTEVTQRQWFEVMGTNPSYFKLEKYCPSEHTRTDNIPLCPNHPVESVSWYDVTEFVRALNLKANDGYTYRLPTEAEWEYAARAGSSTAYSFGDDADHLAESAWYFFNHEGQTHAVAQKKPNLWGLYDMHGNVWEWVSDWYGYYGAEDQVDPLGAPSGSSRVFRGGCWGNLAESLRSAKRFDISPATRISSAGVRLVRTRP